MGYESGVNRVWTAGVHAPMSPVPPATSRHCRSRRPMPRTPIISTIASFHSRCIPPDIRSFIRSWDGRGATELQSRVHSTRDGPAAHGPPRRLRAAPERERSERVAPTRRRALRTVTRAGREAADATPRWEVARSVARSEPTRALRQPRPDETRRVKRDGARERPLTWQHRRSRSAVCARARGYPELVVGASADESAA